MYIYKIEFIKIKYTEPITNINCTNKHNNNIFKYTKHKDNRFCIQINNLLRFCIQNHNLLRFCMFFYKYDVFY